MSEDLFPTLLADGRRSPQLGLLLRSTLGAGAVTRFQGNPAVMAAPAFSGRLDQLRRQYMPRNSAKTDEGPKGIASASGSKRQFAREKIAGAARSTGKFVKDAGVFVGDLNRDGKVDQEDARIAGRKAKKVASATAAGAGKLGKKVLQHDMGKDAAAGAAIGAVVAAPIPVVGSVAGAAVGAIAGVVKNVRSRKK
jgi:hypothetical protein